MSFQNLNRTSQLIMLSMMVEIVICLNLKMPIYFYVFIIAFGFLIGWEAMFLDDLYKLRRKQAGLS